jgi:hypothetical protein
MRGSVKLDPTLLNAGSRRLPDSGSGKDPELFVLGFA